MTNDMQFYFEWARAWEGFSNSFAQISHPVFVGNSKCLTKHKVMFVCLLEITEKGLNADVVIFMAVKCMNYE